MKNKENPIDPHLSEKIKSVGLEIPSPDFTHQVMWQIETHLSSKTMDYKPLISKTTWILLVMIFFVLVCCISMLPLQSSLGWISMQPREWLYFQNLNQLISALHLPKHVFYAICLLGLMIWIQVPILKRRYEKQLSMWSGFVSKSWVHSKRPSLL